MNQRSVVIAALAIVSIAVGIALGGYFIGNTLYKSRIASNLATVKGLAEREVVADVGVWTIPFNATGNSLKEVYANADASKAQVVSFLKEAGFTDKEITPQTPTVTIDPKSYDTKDRPLPRTYTINTAVSIRTGDVQKLATAAQHGGDLVGRGVPIGEGEGNGSGKANGPQYEFTKLNEIKPEMLGEATRNARLAAEQFAKDAHERVGGINAAQQGAFNIVALDDSGTGSSEYGGDSGEASIHKKVRVVTTISFYLED